MKNRFFINILGHFILPVFLSCLVYAIINCVGGLPGSNFYLMALVGPVLIVSGLILFYILTSFHSLGLSILSFVINLIAFRIQTSYLIDKDVSGLLFFSVSAILWSINKLVIDALFKEFKANRESSNVLYDLIIRARSTSGNADIQN